jgi:hypothetical protein
MRGVDVEARVPMLRNGERSHWEAIVYDIRTAFREEADDIAGRLLSLRLVGALPARADATGLGENHVPSRLIASGMTRRSAMESWHSTILGATVDILEQNAL